VSPGTGAPYADWVGRSTEESDRLDLFPARGMSALLDRDPEGLTEGDPLPRGWHWLYFKPTAPRGSLGEDGHPRRGKFLPPIELPRRMWAGGRLRFHGPLVLGEAVARRSEILTVEMKEGRTGRLGLVTVGHAIRGPAGVLVDEEQDLVYRGAPAEGASPRRSDPPPSPAWEETFLPDPVVLFRFSALTFNGHRIHYDHPYATEVEGYPALVVHGPLTALLMLDAAERWTGRPMARFSYRAVSPLFAHRPMTLAGRPAGDGGGVEVWASDAEGGLAMRATAEWEA
jgi:3-methylfumaryl-CoA hydratase